MPQNFTKPVQTRVVETLPSLKSAQIGEIFIETTNNRIYVRVKSGWKYVTLT